MVKKKMMTVLQILGKIRDSDDNTSSFEWEVKSNGEELTILRNEKYTATSTTENLHTLDICNKAIEVIHKEIDWCMKRAIIGA